MILTFFGMYGAARQVKNRGAPPPQTIRYRD
jgi:hypothetical protein